MARPPKFTPEVQRRVLRAIVAGASDTEAAQRAGVSVDTLQRARTHLPAFAAAYAAAKQAAKQHPTPPRRLRALPSPSQPDTPATSTKTARTSATASATPQNARDATGGAPLPTPGQRATAPIPPARRRQGQSLTDEEREAAKTLFLQAFQGNGNVTIACEAAGVDRSTIYRWLEHDMAFLVQYHDAEQRVNDIIRSAIMRRAVFGTQRPLHHNGRVVVQRGPDGNDVPVTVTEYSDTLLMFHAKARMPEYREKTQQQVEISGPGGMPLHAAGGGAGAPADAQTFTLSLRGMSNEDLDLLHAILARAAAREREEREGMVVEAD